jgi:hypothetical protein
MSRRHRKLIQRIERLEGELRRHSSAFRGWDYTHDNFDTWRTVAVLLPRYRDLSL